MIYRQLKPANNLKDTVRCYWSVKGDAGCGIAYKVIPDCCMDIICFDTDMGRQVVLAGASSKLYTHIYSGILNVTGVRFLPGAFYRLFGMPAHYFTGKVTDLRDTGISPEEFFPPHISETSELINHLNRCLTEKDVSPDDFSAELICNSLAGIRGHSMLEHWSAKTFSRRMLERVGLSPRAYANTVRFHRAVKLALTGGFSQADIACRAGYYDQPHLIRFFREYAGSSPCSFLDEIKSSPVRFVQYPLGLF